jgi:thymidylate synthase
MVVLESQTAGEAWLLVAREILGSGPLATYDGETTRELGLLTLVVERPASDDPIIARLGDAEWLAWMHENFFVQQDVAELGGAQSYAVRLFNYDSAGRDQIAWVIDRLRADPASRSATITTFQPLTDTTYVPCVSMLDFWLPAGQLELVVYAHSLDFGKKAYGNLVELARLQEHVAGELRVEPGRLIVHAKSAHIYEPEWTLMAQLAGVAAEVSA